MTAFPRLFCIFFALLALASVGHDVWRMDKEGAEFAFSQIGGLIQLYAHTEHNEARDIIVQEVGAEGFNSFFVPILKMYTVAFTGSLAILFGLWGFLAARKRDAGSSKGKKKKPKW